MTALGDDMLVMLDTRSRQLLYFDLSKLIPTYLRAEPISRRFADVCGIGNRLLLYTDDGGGSVYATADGPNRLAQVVTDVWAPRPPVQRVLNEARLLCSRADLGFGVIGIHSPEITWYAMDGTKKWRREIPGYRRIITASPTQESFSMSIPAGGYHKLTRVALVNDSIAVVQLELVDGAPVGWGGRRALVTHLFSIRDGSAVRGEGIDNEVIAARGSAVWLLGNGLTLGASQAQIARGRR